MAYSNVARITRALRKGMWIGPVNIWTRRSWEPGEIYMGRWQLDKNTLISLDYNGLPWGEFVKAFRREMKYHPGTISTVKDAKYGTTLYGGTW